LCSEAFSRILAQLMGKLFFSSIRFRARETQDLSI
jgi:hypothetical protein